MSIVTFYWPSHSETHRLPGDWTRDELRNKARELGAVAWEEVC